LLPFKKKRNKKKKKYVNGKYDYFDDLWYFGAFLWQLITGTEINNNNNNDCFNSENAYKHLIIEESDPIGTVLQMCLNPVEGDNDVTMKSILALLKDKFGSFVEEQFAGIFLPTDLVTVLELASLSVKDTKKLK